MPGGDRTGPRGQGSGTGWGFGGCVPRGRGRGFGWGRGRGRGWGLRNFFAPYSAEKELEDLKAEREAIDNQINEIEKEKK